MSDLTPADDVQTDPREGSRTLKVTWHPNAIAGAVERATALTSSVSPDDVCPVYWMDLACLLDLARYALTAVGEEPPPAETGASPREPRRWPVGSKEPEEAGLRVQSTTNGVIFRHEFSRWLAESGAGGDGRYYGWYSINGENAAEGGMEVVEVIGRG